MIWGQRRAVFRYPGSVREKAPSWRLECGGLPPFYLFLPVFHASRDLLVTRGRPPSLPVQRDLGSYQSTRDPLAPRRRPLQPALLALARQELVGVVVVLGLRGSCNVRTTLADLPEAFFPVERGTSSSVG